MGGYAGQTVVPRLGPNPQDACAGIVYRRVMATLDVARSVEIDRDAEVVRRQFGDVAHHVATNLHRGVVFEVVEARLTAPLPFALRDAAPILRAKVGKQLAGTLVEDKADLEGEAYGQA